VTDPVGPEFMAPAARAARPPREAMQGTAVG